MLLTLVFWGIILFIVITIGIIMVELSFGLVIWGIAKIVEEVTERRKNKLQ